MHTILITGATSGIGLAAARLLAANGFRILGVGRSRANCEKAKSAICQETPDAVVAYFTADLMQQREVNRIAAALTAYIEANCGGKLYALINNAGCARGYYTTTEDGYEQQFALNYLAGFLLTYRLLPLLQKADGRVLITGSRSHKGIKVHWNDIMLSHRYNPLTAYKQSKLCSTLFAKGLNDRYAACGVRAYVVDPGLVRTDIGKKGAGGLVHFVWSLRRLGGVRPEVPAKTYSFLCRQANTPEGFYYYRCRDHAYSKQVTSENADRLFAHSERLCGISYGKGAVL